MFKLPKKKEPEAIIRKKLEAKKPHPQPPRAKPARRAWPPRKPFAPR